MLIALAALLAQVTAGPAQATVAPAPVPVAPAAPVAIDVARMAALYDEACLKTFPIDGGLDALMVAKGARPLSAADVRISLGDDPGRGWIVGDGGQSFTVLLELPPFHACSVRASGQGGGTPDLAPYRAVVDPFIASHRGFGAQPGLDTERGGIRIHAEAQGRPLPGSGGEMLLVVAQQIVDPAKLAPGTTSTPLRFVHQIKSGN